MSWHGKSNRCRKQHRKSKLWKLSRSEPERMNSLKTDTRWDSCSCGCAPGLCNRFPKQHRRNRSWTRSEPNFPRNCSPSSHSDKSKNGYALCNTIWFRRSRRNRIPSHRYSRSRLPTGCKIYRTYTCHRNWLPHNRNRRICRLHRSQDCPNKRYRYRRSWLRHSRSHRKPPSHCNPDWIYRRCTLNNCCKKHSHRYRTCRKRHSRD